MLYGLISIGTGIVAVAWPGPTLIVLAVVFGVQLIATGLFRVVGSASLGEAGTARALTAILGVVSLLLGLYALRHVLITVLALGLLLGIYWIVDGFTAVFAAVDHPGLPGAGPGAQQLVQLGPHVLIRRRPVDHPPQREVDIPPHHGAPVIRPGKPRVGGKLVEPGLHPAHHHADIEPLQNAPQFIACLASIRRGVCAHPHDPPTP